MEIGKTYVVFIPPGWLLAGTVESLTDTHVVLKDAAYLESAGEGSILGGVALATNPQQQQAACRQAWPLPDGLILSREAILIASPCARDVKPLARAEAAKTIKGAR